MKFLVVVQDLKISGTSEGIVSRSFLCKLRKVYPQAKITVLYLKNIESEDCLDLLPVDAIEQIRVRRSPPTMIKIINRVYWRFYKVALNEKYLINQYRRQLKKIEWDRYDHIFLRSAGNNYETILACEDLPILKRSIINFHDPYPQFWDPGSDISLSGLELNRLKRMWEVVQQAESCMTPSQNLSEDMEYLYGSLKKFHTLPHQYDPAAFPNQIFKEKLEEKRKVVISYHGAVQLGRNLNILLDAYLAILEKKRSYTETTEFVLRITGPYSKEIIEKYQHHPNLVFLEPVSFPESLHEMKNAADILIILENCTDRSNILPGKVPVIASLQKPFLCLSPVKSEMRRLIQEGNLVAACDNREEIMRKLENLIASAFEKKKFMEDPFQGYFDDELFKTRLEEIFGKGNAF